MEGRRRGRERKVNKEMEDWRRGREGRINKDRGSVKREGGRKDE